MSLRAEDRDSMGFMGVLTLVEITGEHKVPEVALLHPCHLLP